jgi:tryptophan-rich sensory protein
VAVAAVVGSLVTNPDSRWYRGLDLPRWQPPPWAFPVAWTALYAEVAIASAAAMAELPEDESTSYARVLAANMTLNAGWSALFFRAHQPWLAALDSAALTASGLDLTRRARPTGAGGALGLGAYAGWSAFATALTAAIALRNRSHTRRR